MKRGEVWLCALDPTRGSEIQKTRPCVVVSPPEVHDSLRTFLAAPMSTAAKAAPFRVPVTFQGKSGMIVLDHLRSLDKSRCVRRLGAVEDAVLERTLAVLREMFEA